MILLIDNYDSFYYNIYQMIGAINPDIKVIRNDELNISEIRALNPNKIIISPGPGRPENAGICIDAVKKLGGEIPILGVCLGHQAICSAFGAKITYAKKLMHRKTSTVTVNINSLLFKNLPQNIQVARYHSLAVDADTIPDALEVTGKTEDGEIMALQHKTLPIYGVQFHPESIMTPDGAVMLENFIFENIAYGNVQFYYHKV